ncbi:hypothetical protein VTN02DRAFT_4353 [Thermoascus thermophilus]
MTLLMQAATLAHQYLYSWLQTPPSKNPGALRLGVLSSSAQIINPATRPWTVDQQLHVRRRERKRKPDEPVTSPVDDVALRNRNSGMTLLMQAATLAHQYLYSWLQTPPSKNPGALRLGVLSSSAQIINPATMILYGIASRDDDDDDDDDASTTAQRLATRYRFTRAYGSCQALLDDEAVDMVYVVATADGMQHEWTSKALTAGKHVLVETPVGANAAEARDSTGNSTPRRTCGASCSTRATTGASCAPTRAGWTCRTRWP